MYVGEQLQVEIDVGLRGSELALEGLIFEEKSAITKQTYNEEAIK